MYKTIRLKEGKEASVYRRHQWIFSGAIDHIDPKITEGSVVEVVDYKGNFLAIGYYYNSSIAIKILSFTKQAIDNKFWQDKIKNAFFYRYKALNIPNKQTNAFRLFNAEGDGIPGLIIDIYDDLAVIQSHNDFIASNIDKIVAALKNIPHEIKYFYHKSNQYLKNIPDTFIGEKCESPKLILENNLGFYIDFINGQKTGFFLDQRENRNFLLQIAKEKKILNLFSYTGAFSVYAYSANALKCTNVDISEPALTLAQKNIEMNFGKNTQTTYINSDVFDFLEKNNETYDIIVVDPPAFAKSRDKQEIALQSYKKLNEAAIKFLNKNGILLTFSCSQVIPREKFQQAVFIAAANIKRSCRIIKQFYQSPDHPIDLFHPESEYLKGLALYFD